MGSCACPIITTSARHSCRLPDVIPVTRRTADRFGLASRVHFVEGDLQPPISGPVFRWRLWGHILHSEGEQLSPALLQETFQALAPGGVIAIAEFLVNDHRTEPPMSLLFAVNMLVNTGEGDTLSFSEISAWLQDLGFCNPRTLDATGPSPLILATKP